jgi:integrase
MSRALKVAAPPEPAAGLFKNGHLWWVRVYDPISRTNEKRSTTTNDLRVANNIVGMLSGFADDSVHGWPWLARIVAGDVPLIDVYNSRYTLNELREKLLAAKTSASDPDLRDWLTRWTTDVQPNRVVRKKIAGPKQQKDTRRFLRVLIPEDEPLLCSQLTEEYVMEMLVNLELQPNTQRNYAFGWRSFYNWALRKKAPVPTDTFLAIDEWLPGPAEPRDKVWSHQERLLALEHLPPGPARAAIALMIGSGMELSALMRVRGQDVKWDGSRTVYADGRKTPYRSRWVTVDEWAWKIFVENTTKVVGATKVFPWSEKTKGAALRDMFYRAQVRAGLLEEPPKSKRGYPLWLMVDRHTIHDCRHTYAVCRGLGLDLEPVRGNEYLSHQLGHSNESTVVRIYKNLKSDRRAQLLTELEALRKMTAVA